MFERYLTGAFATHFGHVVDNLDSDKVRLSAWNGELVLKDLSLRADALESFITDWDTTDHDSVTDLPTRVCNLTNF